MQTVKRPRKPVDLPMRVRRRQSDARWRANVASCFETLKHVIPVNKRANRRQISKACILQETDRHIKCLEDFITTLLQEKANQVRNPNVYQYCQQQWQTIRNEFVVKQKQKLVDQSLERRCNRNKFKVYMPDGLQTSALSNAKTAFNSTSPVRRIIPIHKSCGGSRHGMMSSNQIHERKQAVPRKVKQKPTKADLHNNGCCIPEVSQLECAKSCDHGNNQSVPKRKKNRSSSGGSRKVGNRAKIPSNCKKATVVTLKPSSQILKAALKLSTEDILGKKQGVRLLCSNSEDKENRTSVNVIMIPTSTGVWKGHVVPPTGRMLSHHDQSMLTRKQEENTEALDLSMKDTIQNQVVPTQKQGTNGEESQCVPEDPMLKTEGNVSANTYEQSYMSYLKNLEDNGFAEVPIMPAPEVKKEKEDVPCGTCPGYDSMVSMPIAANQTTLPIENELLNSVRKPRHKVEPISLVFRDLPLSPLAKLETPDKFGSQFPLTPSPTPVRCGKNHFRYTPSKLLTAMELTPGQEQCGLPSNGFTPVRQAPYWEFDTPVSPASSTFDLTPFKEGYDDKWETSSLLCDEDMFNSDKEEESKPYRVKELHAKLKKVRRKNCDLDLAVTSDENCSEKKTAPELTDRLSGEKPAKVPRCRRSLNMDDVKSEPISRPGTPDGNAMEFDRYLNQYEEQIKTGQAKCSLPRVSPTVHKIWQELVAHCQSPESQAVGTANKSSNQAANRKSTTDSEALSDDLKDISVLPIKQESLLEGGLEDFVRMDQFSDGLDEFVTLSWDLNATDEIMYDSSQDDVQSVSAPCDQSVPFQNLQGLEDCHSHQGVVPEVNPKVNHSQNAFDQPLDGRGTAVDQLYGSTSPWHPGEVEMQDTSSTGFFKFPPLDTSVPASLFA